MCESMNSYSKVYSTETFKKIVIFKQGVYHPGVVREFDEKLLKSGNFPKN